VQTRGLPDSGRGCGWWWRQVVSMEGDRRTPRVRVTVRLGAGEHGGAPWQAPSRPYGALAPQEEEPPAGSGKKGGRRRSLLVEGAGGEVHQLQFSQVFPRRSPRRGRRRDRRTCVRCSTRRALTAPATGAGRRGLAGCSVPRQRTGHRRPALQGAQRLLARHGPAAGTAKAEHGPGVLGWHYGGTTTAFTRCNVQPCSPSAHAMRMCVC